MSGPTGPEVRVCIVGAGPRGTGVLQMLCALVLGGGCRALRVDVVDPHPAGPGAIWRRDQSALLWMNSQIGAVGEAERYPEPLRLPPLVQWLSTDGPARLGPGELAAEFDRVSPGRFASRPLVSEYFRWVFDTTVHRSAGPVEVVVHRDRVVDLGELPDGSGRQVVELDAAPEPLVVDHVVLSQGHTAVLPDRAERADLGFARHHGRYYRPPGAAEPLPVADVPPGEDLLLRGLGLTAVDQITLLTQGRGGRFERTAHGLGYRPSGAEPVLHAGSRRGVPHLPKPGYRVATAAGPTHLTRAAVEPLLDRHGALDFRAHLWPLVVEQLAAAHYLELFTAWPERTAVPWPDFVARTAGRLHRPDSTARVVAAAVPDPADRFDLAALAHPLAGRSYADRQALQDGVRGVVREAVRRRDDPRRSADLAVLAALGSAITVTLELVVAGCITARSQLVDVEGWFLPLGSFLSSGPPLRRARELLALAEAGVLRFVGPVTRIRADPGRAAFVASSPAVPGEVVAPGLVEARLPGPALGRTADPLLAALYRRGECLEELAEDETGAPVGTGRLAVRAADHRLLLPGGGAHPARFALGPGVATVPDRRPLPAGAATLDPVEQNARVAREILRGTPLSAGSRGRCPDAVAAPAGG